MQQAGQGADGRHPSSPRASNGSSHPKFSLLGQQLTSYTQQTSAGSSNMGFSLAAQLQNHQSHSQAFAQVQAMNGGGNGGPAGERNHTNFYQNSGGNTGDAGDRNYANFVQNMNNPPVGGPSFSHGNNQNNGAFMNQLPRQDNMNIPDTSPEAIMSALQIIQQKIGQLQAIVPLLAASTNAQVGNSQPQQPQVAAASTMSMISQLAAAVSSIFPVVPPSPQQGPAIPSQQQQQPMSNNSFTGSRNQQLQEIIQHMGDSLPPHAYNFFQQQGGASNLVGQQALASLSGIAMGNPVGSNFPGMQGNNGGNNLANSLSSLGPGLVGNLSGVFGCDAGAPVNVASPGQNSRNKEMGVVNSNQMGNSSTRNSNLVAGPVVRESNPVSRSPPPPPPPPQHQHHHHPVTGSSSQLDDDTSKRRQQDEDDDGEGEKLDPSEYELIEMDAVEILAEHTHFCEICGKGFKRDANLRMHMRGHGDEYKTPAALARPDKAAHDQAAVKERRYSCPYAGCKRNKKHRKFAPLKTMLCVKNHYRRSHCPKMLSCAKCKSKKFSVVADLKTHEKHCGCDKWQCSCGTTFSRKDKLLGHISLFAGHTPAVPLDGDSQKELEALDSVASGHNHASQQQEQSVNDSSQYNLSGSSGMASEMMSGSGIGHVLQGMHGRLGESPDVGSDVTPSSSYSQSGQGLLPQSSMLSGLFTSNFLQGSSAGSGSSDCLH